MPRRCFSHLESSIARSSRQCGRRRGARGACALVALTTLERPTRSARSSTGCSARRSTRGGRLCRSHLCRRFASQDWPRARRRGRDGQPTMSPASAGPSCAGSSSARPCSQHVLRSSRPRMQDALRVRLAGALFRIGWPGDGDAGSADFLRSILLEDRLRAGRPRPAPSTSPRASRRPAPILSLIVQHALRSASSRRAGTGWHCCATRSPSEDRDDRRSAGRPRRRITTRMLDRVALSAQRRPQCGRAGAGRGRSRATCAATVAAGEDGMWLINEAGYALIALGRERRGGGADGAARRACRSPSNPQLISLEHQPCRRCCSRPDAMPRRWTMPRRLERDRRPVRQRLWQDVDRLGDRLRAGAPRPGRGGGAAARAAARARATSTRLR